MRLVAKSFIVVLALVCSNTSSHGQSIRDNESVKRIIEVLNSMANDAKKWDDKAVAARTQAQIADLSWDTNHENAVEVLKAAWATAMKVEEPKRDRSTIVNQSLRNRVRREVLLVARKRAPELSATWLEEMAEESKSAEKNDRGTFDDRSARSAVLLQMANELVADNPKAAAELLVESLRDGISFNFQTTLIRIQQKDPVLATTVFRAALARLRTAGLSDPNELFILYSYLYTPGRVFAANTTDNRDQVQLAIGGTRVAIPPGRQDRAMAREFLDLASDLLLSTQLPQANAQGAARSFVSAIGMLLRETTEALPEKAALLRARAQQLEADAQFSIVSVPRRADIPEVRPGESKESFSERRVDLLEESAANGRDTLTRDIGYATAAVATTVQRYERGLDLTGKIDDKMLREGVRSWLIYRAVLHFIASDKLDEAYKLNLKNGELAQRAVCLVIGAQKLVKNRDVSTAGDWLREAGTLIRRSDPSESSARVALGIVSTYGNFDTQAALEWLGYAAKLMHKVSSASLNDDKAPGLKRISGVTPVSDFTSNTAGFSLPSAVAVFTPDQFEQVLSVLNDMTPQEARGIAVLTLCSNFLRTAVNTQAQKARKP